MMEIDPEVPSTWPQGQIVQSQANEPPAMMSHDHSISPELQKLANACNRELVRDRQNFNAQNGIPVVKKYAIYHGPGLPKSGVTSDELWENHFKAHVKQEVQEEVKERLKTTPSIAEFNTLQNIIREQAASIEELKKTVDILQFQRDIVHAAPVLKTNKRKNPCDTPQQSTTDHRAGLQLVTKDLEDLRLGHTKLFKDVKEVKAEVLRLERTGIAEKVVQAQKKNFKALGELMVNTTEEMDLRFNARNVGVIRGNIEVGAETGVNRRTVKNLIYQDYRRENDAALDQHLAETGQAALQDDREVRMHATELGKSRAAQLFPPPDAQDNSDVAHGERSESGANKRRKLSKLLF